MAASSPITRGQLTNTHNQLATLKGFPSPFQTSTTRLPVSQSRRTSGKPYQLMLRHKSSCSCCTDSSHPILELESIANEEQFDFALAQAQQYSKPLIVDWMAAWCRKCIYLKPKLEKLAAEFQPDVKFYCVDVNAVPQALVKRAEITVICCGAGQLLGRLASFVLLARR